VRAANARCGEELGYVRCSSRSWRYPKVWMKSRSFWSSFESSSFSSVGTERPESLADNEMELVARRGTGTNQPINQSINQSATSTSSKTTTTMTTTGGFTGRSVMVGHDAVGVDSQSGDGKWAYWCRWGWRRASARSWPTT